MKTRIALVVLALGLLLSLAINAFVVWQVLSFKAAAFNTVVSARAALSDFTMEPFTTMVQVDQVLPLAVEIPINQTFTVPIDTTYSLDTIVNTTIAIPLLGPQNIAVPIRGEIPLQLTLEIPVRMTVPISTSYHLQVSLPVEVSLPPEVLEALDQTLQEIETGLR